MEKWEQIANQYFSKELVDYKKTLSGGRRPDAVEFTNIEGDVQRRDLTINALFYDIDTHEIVDLVGGLDDIKNGVVRTVGAPEDRFGEDRLRILRAIRFAGRFGSDLDPATNAALMKDASLEGISAERIRDEFIKGLKTCKSTGHFLDLLDRYDLFDWIFPSLNVNTKIIAGLNLKHDDYLVLIARLLKGNNIDLLRKKLNALTYSINEIKGISFLIAMLHLTADNAVLLKRAEANSGISKEQLTQFGKEEEGMNSQLLNAFNKFNLSVTGPQVMQKLNLTPGPELGSAIQKMETNNFNNLL